MKIVGQTWLATAVSFLPEDGEVTVWGTFAPGLRVLAGLAPVCPGSPLFAPSVAFVRARIEMAR